MRLAGAAITDVDRAEFNERWRSQGSAALADLSPPWIAAILEPDRLVIARDHVGMRSLAWGRLGARILFAS